MTLYKLYYFRMWGSNLFKIKIYEAPTGFSAITCTNYNGADIAQIYNDKNLLINTYKTDCRNIYSEWQSTSVILRGKIHRYTL